MKKLYLIYDYDTFYSTHMHKWFISRDIHIVEVRRFYLKRYAYLHIFFIYGILILNPTKSFLEKFLWEQLVFTPK